MRSECGEWRVLTDDFGESRFIPGPNEKLVLNPERGLAKAHAEISACPLDRCPVKGTEIHVEGEAPHGAYNVACQRAVEYLLDNCKVWSAMRILGYSDEEGIKFFRTVPYRRKHLNPPLRIPSTSKGLC